MTVLVSVLRDVSPAQEPLTVPPAIYSAPISSRGTQYQGRLTRSGVGVLILVDLGEFALIGLGVGLALVGAETMVEVVDHLRLVKG